jgi:hypothetical protein
MENIDFDRQGNPVFHDVRGRRGRYFSVLYILLGGIVTALLTVFVISVLINPFLPQIKL